jgi:hypothetical protein
MTNDEIINLAIENTIHGLKFDEEGLLRFAKLVAQHEREACAKECDACICTAQASEAIRARSKE